MLHRTPLALALLLVAALIAVAPAAAQGQEFTSCSESNFECTRVDVPLDRSGGVPGQIPLYVERFPGGGRDAVFALAGGPGQGNSSVTESFNRDLAPILTGGRYLVVFDQRGTGNSEALNCPELDGREQDSGAIDVRSERCAERLGPSRAFYTTRDSVEDMEAVRKRIGDERITIYGVSYGTKVAVAYALKYPEHVDRLILDSVVAPEGQDPFDLDTFAAIPRVLREICRAECRGVTRNLPADVARLAERLRTAPLRGTWVDRRGRRRTVGITARDLYGRLRVGDLNAQARAEYPGAIRSAIEGDPAPLLRIEHRFDSLADPTDEPVPPEAVKALSFSLFTATLCEEAPLPWERTTASPAERLRQARERAAGIPDAAFAPFDRETAVALDANSLLLQCSRWPAAAEPPALAAGPLPDVPVLVLEGREDMRTPLEVGARVARRFARGTVVSVPKTGHGVLGERGAPCAGIALRRWFAGRDPGRPCASMRRATRVRPKLPESLSDVAPARGVRGAGGRALAAVVLTLDDFYREYGEVSLLLDDPSGGGLRGGRWAARGRGASLSRLSLVRGVSVTGRLGDLQRPSGRLEVSGGRAGSGTLTLGRNGVLSGRLGGRSVRTRFKAPAPSP